MKLRIALSLLLAAACASAQSGLFVGYRDRAACAAFPSYTVQQTCEQMIVVTVRAANPQVRGYVITIRYLAIAGPEREQQAYVPVIRGFASTAFTDVDDVVLRRVTAEPLVASSDTVTREF